MIAPATISGTIQPKTLSPAIAALASHRPCISIAVTISPAPRPLRAGTSGRPMNQISPAPKTPLNIQCDGIEARVAYLDRRPCRTHVAERIGRADERVADVLADLEAKPDERAEDEPVERAADQLRRERDEQHDARALRELLVDRRGQRGAPVEGEARSERLRVQAHHGVVAEEGERADRRDASPDEAGGGQLGRDGRVAILVVDEPQVGDREQAEGDDPADERAAVGRCRDRDLARHDDRADYDQQAVDPEGQVVWLHEAELLAPPGLLDRAAPVVAERAHDPPDAADHRDDVVAPAGYRAFRARDDDLDAFAGRLPSRPEDERDDRSLLVDTDEVLRHADDALASRDDVAAGRRGDAPPRVLEVVVDLVDPRQQRRRRPFERGGPHLGARRRRRRAASSPCCRRASAYRRRALQRRGPTPASARA